MSLLPLLLLSTPVTCPHALICFSGISTKVLRLALKHIEFLHSTVPVVGGELKRNRFYDSALTTVVPTHRQPGQMFESQDDPLLTFLRRGAASKTLHRLWLRKFDFSGEGRGKIL
jgi:hypothetical protein